MVAAKMEALRKGRPLGVRHGGGVVLALLATALSPSWALADEPAAPAEGAASSEVAACVAAHAEVQQLRKGHRLLEAGRVLKGCTRPACPAPVLRDCGAWIEEIERATPSVVFNVTSGGEQLAGPTIVVDGQPVELSSDGAPLRLDPGKHTYRVEHGGYGPVTKDFILFEGQRFRQLNVALEPVVVASGLRPEAPAMESYRPVPALTYALAGVGVAGAASFAVWGLMGRSERDHLEATCSPRCTDSDLDVVRTRYLIADISLGVGAAAFAGAALTYLLRPTRERPVAVSVIPSRTGVSGAVLFRGM
ncbi:uncharacterized protein SOCE26_097460 [Sorangium cellulosum]|uniref:PEGA domain-containing protein n=1 Tax=Sorangium cellulosum TaxID=56 RepID=A0A2L0F9F2_SORCE|nr:hypothetical protein [Sorangium cellulosum]AUX48215.1 uncharacterized protein SOCE26_097460 [Sorangium cellulosum]